MSCQTTKNRIRRTLRPAQRFLAAAGLLIAGCGLVVGAYLLAYWVHLDKGFSRNRIRYAGWLAAWVLVFGTPLFLAARRWWLNARSARRATQGLCPSCGYNVRFGSPTCPECGTDVGGAALSARISLHNRGQFRRAALVLAIGYFVYCTALLASANLTALVWFSVELPIEAIAKPLWYSRSFDAELWRSPEAARGNGGAWSPRACMLDDLIGHRRLDGLSRDEVAQTLGPPSAGFTCKTGSIAYRIGPERGFMPMDNEWLVIDFDANDRVTKLRVQTD